MALSALPEALDEWRDIIHPAALLLPRPNPTDYLGLKASIEERGVLQPLATYVDLKGDHWLLDGVSRLQIMVELGMTVLDPQGQWGIPTTQFFEEKGDDPYAIALSLNVSRRHLSNEQKRQLIEDLRAQRPDLSDRAIARMAGVSAHLVGDVRREDEDEEALLPASEEIAEEVSEAAGEASAETAPRVEESGQRARGRQPVTQAERAERERTRELGGGPFIGTVLPTGKRAARIAEARRCIRWLGLVPEDILPKPRIVH